MSEIAWPRKTREFHNHHMNSTVWNDFAFRPDDVVIATYAKSGTTWMQQIVGQLVFRGKSSVPVHEISPWLDMRCMPQPETMQALEAQTHRRFIKTHLPVDALVFSPMAKYVYIGRDGRDVVWSMHNHHMQGNDQWYALLNDTPGRVGPPIERPDPDAVHYFRRWLAEDGHPFWPFWENVRSWWAIRDLPNVMLVHFSELKRDLRGSIGKLAQFLGIPLSDELLDRITAQCSFEHMKAIAADVAPLGGAIFEGGAGSFINKGTNGRWREVLSPADSTSYEARAEAELGPDCARWLKGEA